MTDPLRAKAEAIAADLMDNGTGIPTHRLLLVDNRHRGCGGGWSQANWTSSGCHYTDSKSSDDIVGPWVDPPQPKWRPFNEQELLKLVGRSVQRITDGKPDRWLVNRVRKDWVEIASWLAVSSAELLEKFELVGADGETLYKCGVLEVQS